jgi:hypothetical protein
MAPSQSLRPSKKFWAAAVALSIACVAFFYYTGIANTPFGEIFSDFLGMTGAIVLLYAAAQSLPTRERVENLVQLASSSDDKIVKAIKKNLSKEVSNMAKSDIKNEWHFTIAGAGMLCASFGISMSGIFLNLP